EPPPGQMIETPRLPRHPITAPLRQPRPPHPSTRLSRTGRRWGTAQPAQPTGGHLPSSDAPSPPPYPAPPSGPRPPASRPPSASTAPPACRYDAAAATPSPPASPPPHSRRPASATASTPTPTLAGQPARASPGPRASGVVLAAAGVDPQPLTDQPHHL